MSEASKDDAQDKTIPPLEDFNFFDDDASIREANELSSGLTAGELKKQSDKNHFTRRERFKDHFECIVLIILWSIIFIVVVMALVWVYHMITPMKWHWLEPTDVEHLQTMLVGGVGGVISTIASKNLKDRIE